MSDLKYCEKCHSQLDELGNHYHMTECVTKKIKELEQQLSNSIPKEAVRELAGEWTEAAKQCEEAGMTSISEWEIVHDLNKLLEGDNNE